MKAMIMLAAVLAAGRAWADTGTAAVQGTAAGSPISGTVRFLDTKEGLKVTAVLEGLPPGLHGFHIHEFGSCSEAGKGAGAHYNPKGAPHGSAVHHGIKKAHAGDLGNLTVGADGKAALEVVVKKLFLSSGKASVGGRAVIVHEKADDFGQPAGNAGGRIACGVIALAPAPGAP